MVRLLFLLPLCLCVIWFLYLKSRGYTIAQGKQGFTYILIFSAIIAGFYALLIMLTR